LTGTWAPDAALRGSAMSLENTFTKIWSEGLWIPPGGDAPRSGCGSSLHYTENLRRELPKLIEGFAIRSLFDAPCGDFTWMRAIQFPEQFSYLGADIVEPLIQQLRARHTEHVFLHLDLTTDPFPAADLLLCRDCLIHLSFADIAKIFVNCLNSPIRYLLTNSYLSAPNLDITTGEFRPLDLLSPPFGFGAPIAAIDDWVQGFPPRSMMLWEMKSIELPMRLFIAKHLREFV